MKYCQAMLIWHLNYKWIDIKKNIWKAISECFDELNKNREYKIIIKIVSDFLHHCSRRWDLVMYKYLNKQIDVWSLSCEEETESIAHENERSGGTPVVSLKRKLAGYRAKAKKQKQSVADSISIRRA